MPPTKSAALAGLVTVPVTAHWTVSVVVVLFVRVTVKVKFFVPELPSVWTALVEERLRFAAVKSLTLRIFKPPL